MKSNQTETVLELFDLINNPKRPLSELTDEYHNRLKKDLGRHYDKVMKELDAPQPK